MNIWDIQTLLKSAYGKCVAPICSRHQLTRMELDVLLFLANNPQFDTASDIIEKKRLTKSHVSTSVKSLEEKGFIRKTHYENNRKAAHLRITPDASSIIKDGQLGQKKFADILFAGFTDDDMAQAKQFFCMIMKNIEVFLCSETL